MAGKSHKIVGIGFGKTGTSTLADCLKQLGYRHFTWNKHFYDAYAAGNMAEVDRVLDAHDSFDDWPWPELYRYVDARHPGSRFVLTRRKDVDTFLRSLDTHANRRSDKTRLWQIYGMPQGVFQPEVAAERYLRHTDEVRQYFAERPQDLLELCWETGDGWAQLAPFLGHPVPSTPLPKVYATPSDAEYWAQERRRRLIPRFIRQWLK